MVMDAIDPKTKPGLEMQPATSIRIRYPGCLIEIGRLRIKR
jgi:hypothetical protein